MEELLVLILQFLAEVAFQLLFEFAVDSSYRSVAESIRARSQGNPVIAWFGVGVLGFLGGFVAYAVFPKRISPPIFGIPGASLIFAPLAAGVVMHYIGKRRQRPEQSLLSTFWGAAVCAFIIAAVRFVLVTAAAK